MSDTETISSLKVEELPGGVATSLRVEEEYLNYSHAERVKRGLKKICREKLDKGHRNFVLDLSVVRVMDSCGLSVLISVKKALDLAGARVVLAGASPMITRLLAITKLDRVFDIHPDVTTAAAALA